MVNNLLNSLSLMVLISKYLLSLLDKVPTISKKIVDEIIDNDLEENIGNKFINIYKGHVDLKEVIIMEVGKNKTVLI